MVADGTLRLWRYALDLPDVVEVECPQGRYPASDADGFPIYDNTHFDTREEAVRALYDNVAAMLSIEGRGVTSAEGALTRAQVSAAHAAALFAMARELFKGQDGWGA